MNQLTAKIDVNEDFEFGRNSVIATSSSYHLDGLIKKGHTFDVLISSGNLFEMKIKDLNNGDDLIEIKGFLPNQVGRISLDSCITLISLKH